MNSFQDSLNSWTDNNNVIIRKHDILIHNNSLYIAITCDFRYTVGIECHPIEGYILENLRDKKYSHPSKIYPAQSIVVPESIIDFIKPGSKKIYNEIIKLL